MRRRTENGKEYEKFCRFITQKEDPRYDVELCDDNLAGERSPVSVFNFLLFNINHKNFEDYLP